MPTRLNDGAAAAAVAAALAVCVVGVGPDGSSAGERVGAWLSKAGLVNIVGSRDSVPARVRVRACLPARVRADLYAGMNACMHHPYFHVSVNACVYACVCSCVHHVWQLAKFAT